MDAHTLSLSLPPLPSPPCVCVPPAQDSSFRSYHPCTISGACCYYSSSPFFPTHAGIALTHLRSDQCPARGCVRSSCCWSPTIICIYMLFHHLTCSPPPTRFLRAASCFSLLVAGLRVLTTLSHALLLLRPPGSPHHHSFALRHSLHAPLSVSARTRAHTRAHTGARSQRTCPPHVNESDC